MSSVVMPTIRLIHSNAGEARSRATLLRQAGYRVVCTPFDAGELKALAQRPPDVVVIDLSRALAQGRDVAVALRTRRSTRQVPIAFVEGDSEKLEKVRRLLPDAIFTTWGRIHSALKRAVAHPPASPIVPASNLAGYSNTPLPKKLGVRPGYTVIMVGAPAGFERTLGAVPEDVRLRRRALGRADLVLWFVRTRTELERRVGQIAALAGRGGLWIIWPKQTSGVRTDLTQAQVRKLGLAAGLVDYKVCAIDATWSGLRFTRRKAS